MFISEALAVELGIDPAHVQASDPSPQVRVVIDSPVHSAGYRRTATFTVARVCTGAGPYDWNIQIENSREYVPNRTDLEGRSEDNIVNWISHADGSAVWGGIQLEQSSCLRRESDCDIDGNGANESCTSPSCMHEIVARGVARALAELLDANSPANPAGSCCTNFNQCP